MCEGGAGLEGTCKETVGSRVRLALFVGRLQFVLEVPPRLRVLLSSIYAKLHTFEVAPTPEREWEEEVQVRVRLEACEATDLDGNIISAQSL